MPAPAPSAVTFDFGQTLAELDTELLAARLRERGLAVDPHRLERAVPEAWQAYDDEVRRGVSGHPWKLLMRTLLLAGGLPAPRVATEVDWLWGEQPRRNLWRRLLPDMVLLARDLSAAGVPVGVISNSEGGLCQLVGELGLADLFRVLADSGQLGIEKPDRRIFDWAAERLGVETASLVHVGDSFGADVMGAHDAGAFAVYFPRTELPVPLERARSASDAAGVRRALADFGLRF
jgi:FMN phosphatase YigB (HAD superfamily)